MFQTLADWLKRRRDRAELDALDEDERDRVAHDLGVSATELDFLVQQSHDPIQLPRMLAALGIDEGRLLRAQPALLRDMQRVCSLCGLADACSHMITDGVAGQTYPVFCPNADTLKALAAKAGHRH